ncbi:MAG: hypothetical protein EOP10_04485 [Proteobacteria bacterium]|nr:MAG: hypothetical protein EOP10_04485 [Pseudomonadota bacterium]
MRKIAILFLALTLWANACKKKVERPGTNAQTIPTAPGSSNDKPANPEQPANTDVASDELFALVLAGLKAKHAAAENQTWFQSQGVIEGDWIAYSPKNYWGKTILELPAGYDCKKGNIGCDIQFERKLCSTDADCAASRTQCLPFLASVTKPGDQPKLMCLGSGDKVMDDYYSTLIKTEKHLDISSLTLPSGRFRTAMINGLTYLTHKLPSFTFRLLLSSTDGITPNLFNRPSKVMGEILAEIDGNGGDSKKIKMNLGYLSDKKVSWNHTKIVLADSNHLLQGGHNFLDPDYVREQPIFDLSMHVSGSVGEGVQKFVDHLWSNSSSWASNFGKDEKVVPPAPTASGGGKVKIIGMGRMGSYGDNASDEGFRLLLKSAKKTIYLAQQDIYNDITKLGAKPPHALPELVDAVLRGVHLKVVQSSSTAFLGYGTVAPDKAAVMLREAIIKEADVRKFVPPNNLSLGEYLCQQVEYAPFLFHPKVLRWANDTDIGVHPKLIIIDETGFYMGSQNFYPSDLQEFGLFISDSPITAQLLDQYWNKIWANSSLNKVACR